MLMRLTLLFLSALGIGFVSALVGIGGGALIIPLLILGFGFDAKRAIATSLLCVVTTSLVASSEYLQRGLVDLNTALVLEPSTALGAALGALITIALPERIVKLALGTVFLYVAISMFRRYLKPLPMQERMGTASRSVGRLLIAVILSFIAGMFSGMLGIGGGVIKVPIMVMVLNMPTRIAVATSSFMIGITGASGGIVYTLKGLPDPYAYAALALGIIPGASIGARILKRVNTRILGLAFATILLYASLRLIISSW